MMTRQHVEHQYGSCPGEPPPFHTGMQPHQYQTGQARAWPAGGGLEGGAVALNTAGWVGVSRANTGYGYLGMDPSDPATWIRPFAPQPGMIGYLNGIAR